jgi:APA family basic amino acid/polyamine antiporter
MVMGALLLLEYGLAASVVAVGWSGYVVSLLGDFGLLIPSFLTGPTGHHLQKDGVDVLVNGAPVVYLFNLPAFLVCSALAILLVIGVSESAKFNNAIVAIKVTVLGRFHRRRRLHHSQEPAYLHAQLGPLSSASNRRKG